MPQYRSLNALEKALQSRLQKAMNVASEKALADMYEQTGDFYAGGEPIMYERTGALGDTPKTTAVQSSGNDVSFKAYLDTAGGYSTGKNPSMLEVLKLTNDGSYPGLRPAKGKTGYWDRAKEQIIKDTEDTIKSFF